MIFIENYESWIIEIAKAHIRYYEKPTIRQKRFIWRFFRVFCRRIYILDSRELERIREVYAKYQNDLDKKGMKMLEI